MEPLPTSAANVRVRLNAPFDLPEGGLLPRGAGGKVLAVWPDGTLEVDFETTPRETVVRVPLDQLTVLKQEPERWAIVDLLHEQQTVIGRVHDADNGGFLITPQRSLPHGPWTYDPPSDPPSHAPSDATAPPAALQIGQAVALIHTVQLPEIDITMDAETAGLIEAIEDGAIIVHFPDYGVVLAMDAADLRTA